MEEYEYSLRIPKERVAILIGKNGSVKRNLQKLTNTKIKVDSQEGDVILTGSDTVSMYQLKDVVKAVGRGFNPDIAQLLLKQDYILEIITVTEFVQDRKNQVLRVKGRVIGKDGRARNTIETISDTFISVYGKTISIIGSAERANAARHAIESLLNGSPHGPVYKKLELTMKDIKKKELLS